MMQAPQLTFDIALGLPEPAAVDESPDLAPTLPEGLMGMADVLQMQAEGWGFADGGVKTANCYAVWAAKGSERKMCFLADPDQYPEAWPEPEGQP